MKKKKTTYQAPETLVYPCIANQPTMLRLSTGSDSSISITPDDLYDSGDEGR